MQPMSRPAAPSSGRSGADVLDVTIDRAAAELRLEFDDGTTGSIDLTELRVHCPCATCRAARQAGRAAWNAPDGACPSVTGAELVGAWGLGIAWDDGHATGIYPFSSLHDWIVTGSPSFSADSGLGG
jgi:ATP-binding protein involved in chromosome partitioning